MMPCNAQQQMEIAKVETNERYESFSCGFVEFDKALKLTRGQFVVVTGYPGHGKTRLLDQIAVQLSELVGMKWGIFAPESTTTQHIADLIEIRAGRPFHEGLSRRMNEATMLDALDWIGDNFFFTTSKGHTPTIDWVLQQAMVAVLRHGVTGLIIDPCNEFSSQIVDKCKRFAKTHNVAVLMVTHPPSPQRPKAGEQLPIPSLEGIEADAGLVVYRDFDQQRTRVFAKNASPQSGCGELSSVDFAFIGTTRRFEEQTGSYKPLSNQ